MLGLRNLFFLCFLLIFTSALNIRNFSSSEDFDSVLAQTGRCKFKRPNGNGVVSKGEGQCSQIGEKCKDSLCQVSLNGKKFYCTCSNCGE